MQIVQGDEPPALADQSAVQPVQQLVALLFMHLEMARRMKRDRWISRATRPDPQRDLLGHGSAGQEDRCFLAQQRRDLPLEVIDQAPLTIAIGLLVGASLRRQLGQDCMWPLRSVARQEALTSQEGLLPLTLQPIIRVRH